MVCEFCRGIRWIRAGEYTASSNDRQNKYAVVDLLRVNLNVRHDAGGEYRRH